MTYQYSHETDESVLSEELVDTGKSAQIVVYNDDVNTFEWVIECFIEILKHSYEQAEQLSLLIHFKGKAIVKTDTYEALKPKKDALVERGLSAVIEEFVP